MHPVLRSTERERGIVTGPHQNCSYAAVDEKTRFGVDAYFLLTVWMMVEEVLTRKFASPAYLATIECGPMPLKTTLSEATPSVNVAVPSFFRPSLNCT